MPDVWELAAAVGVGAVLAATVALLVRRTAAPAVTFADGREERLTRRLAELVRCPLPEALPAVRREIALAPGQSDETLLKRAAYHYRQDLPDRPCQVYRDRAPG